MNAELDLVGRPALSATSAPVLEVEDLAVELRLRNRTVHPLNHVSFRLGKGETLGIVGESGSGKSMLALALMRLLPSPFGHSSGGRIVLDGQDVTHLDERGMRELRGRKISMVFQEPMTALDPLFTVGSQVAETIAAHERVGRKEARERALDLLSQVGITSPRERLDAYPHQLSGGMRQRIVIAIGIALRPKVLIADEPTTALDVTVQAQIMDLLAQMQERLGMGLILITHDLGLVSENTDCVAVMYGGKIVESATTSALFSTPTHPYTQGLIRAKAGGTDQRGRLHVISGLPPTLTSPVRSCPFAPRCDRAVASCSEQMPPITARRDDASHHFACWNPLQ